MTTPQPPYMQPYPPPGPPQPGKRHRLRNAILAASGALVLIIVIAGIAGGSKHTAAPASHPKAATPAAATAPSPAAALSAGATKFVSAVRNALAAGGYSSSATDAQLAHVGTEICTLRAAGGSQADVTGVVSGAEAKFSMSAGKFVRTAERDMCPSQLPVVQTVEYIVTGDSADVTYGPAGSNDSGPVPMNVTADIPASPPAYYAISAQLQGGGTVSCTIKVDGQAISTATASGGYNIADCEIGQDPLTGQWQNDNSG